MAQISFSIVVVCLNAGEKLLPTVQSVLDQRYGNYEIIVKDGGSTDAVWKSCLRTAGSRSSQRRIRAFMTA